MAFAISLIIYQLDLKGEPTHGNEVIINGFISRPHNKSWGKRVLITKIFLILLVLQIE